ncbi:hypothetical protein VspSTUT11_40930 [Vibrio sp. STUT-A11]|nr:hypothetical protein VspSTUT11_40930 [Vibrio sp. STUT-A11]
MLLMFTSLGDYNSLSLVSEVIGADHYVVVPDQEPAPEVSLFMDWLEEYFPS